METLKMPKNGGYKSNSYRPTVFSRYAPEHLIIALVALVLFVVVGYDPLTFQCPWFDIAALLSIPYSLIGCKLRS